MSALASHTSGGAAADATTRVHVRLVLTLMMLAAASQLAAQGRASEAATDIVGTYTLERVNGSEIFIGLPIGAGKLEIRPDGTFDMKITWHGGLRYRYYDDKGTLVRSGGQLTLVSALLKVPFGSSPRVTEVTSQNPGGLTMDYYWGPESSVKQFLWVKAR